MNRLILVLALILLSYLWLADGSVELGPGVLAPDSPTQTKIDEPSPFTAGDYRITPLADFAVTAKVLSKERYRLDRAADLSPIDLALGWGRMSDEAILEEIDISQSGRWYRWRTQTMPIPRREIETHSANMHMIPADEFIEDALGSIKPGEIVSLRGKLVRVEADDGWRWASSMTRKDTGGRACELVYVERVDTEI